MSRTFRLFSRLQHQSSFLGISFGDPRLEQHPRQIGHEVVFFSPASMDKVHLRSGFAVKGILAGSGPPRYQGLKAVHEWQKSLGLDDTTAQVEDVGT